MSEREIGILARRCGAADTIRKVEYVKIFYFFRRGRAWDFCHALGEKGIEVRPEKSAGASAPGPFCVRVGEE